MVSPFNTLLIITYQNEVEARNAAKNLAYYKINYIQPIYIEFAPEGIFSGEIVQKQEQETDEIQLESTQNIGKSVFVKNLNFNTSD